MKKIGIPIGSAMVAGAACLFLTKGYYQEPSSVMTTEIKANILESKIAFWQDSATHQLVEHSLAVKQDLDVLSKKVKPRAIAKAKPGKQRVSPRKRTQLAKENITTKSEKLYTIQLVASPDKRDMTRYKKSNKLAGNYAKLNHYKENNVVWYVLTKGEYTNMTEAQQIISQLPPELMRLNPWVRPINTLG